MRQLISCSFLIVLSACIKDTPFDDLEDDILTGDVPPLPTETRIDQVTQVVEPEVDVLFVVDNSCSMEEEQALLGANFDAFINWFIGAPLDWHVGVVSTDMLDPSQSGRLRQAGSRNWIDSSTPDPHRAFAQMTNLGITGSIDEKGFAATLEALTDPLASTNNQGFYREDASLLVVFVSDADDNSAPEVTLPEFRNFLKTLKAEEDMVTASAIVGTRNSNCVIEFEGTSYANIAQTTGGLTFDICQTDWAPVLDALGATAATPRIEFILTDVPVEETIEITVMDNDYVYTGTTMDEECDGPCFTYQYNGLRNAVTFIDFVPSSLATIEIRYEILRGVR